MKMTVIDDNHRRVEKTRVIALQFEEDRDDPVDVRFQLPGDRFISPVNVEWKGDAHLEECIHKVLERTYHSFDTAYATVVLQFRQRAEKPFAFGVVGHPTCRFTSSDMEVTTGPEWTKTGVPSV